MVRFSGRARDYALYRPSYPPALIEALISEASFAPGKVVADVGAGTGKLSALFAEHGAVVCCIEPNPEMLRVCARELAAMKNCHFLRATAEHTGLASCSIDMVSAGQSFHWFDTRSAAREFLRILRPDGCVFVVWNTRIGNANAFMAAYGRLLGKYGTREAAGMSSERDAIAEFFAGAPFSSGHLPNSQRLGFEGFMGRLRSSSYLPLNGSPDYESMLIDARALFDRFAKEGFVELLYRTEYFIGRPAKR